MTDHAESVSYEKLLSTMFAGELPTDDDWKVQRHQSFDQTGTIVVRVGLVKGVGLVPGDTLHVERNDDGVFEAYNLNHGADPGPVNKPNSADDGSPVATEWPKRISQLKWVLSDGTEVLGESNARMEQMELDEAATREADDDVRSGIGESFDGGDREGADGPAEPGA